MTKSSFDLIDTKLIIHLLANINLFAFSSYIFDSPLHTHLILTYMSWLIILENNLLAFVSCNFSHLEP